MKKSLSLRASALSCLAGKRTRHRQRKQELRAYLLLDALIATFVGVTIMLSATAMIITGAVAADAARQNNIAYNCGRQILENIRLRKGAKLVDQTYSDPTVFGPVPQLAYLRNGTASVSISTWRASSKPLKMVAITVSWRAGQDGGKPRQRVITALTTPQGVGL